MLILLSFVLEDFSSLPDNIKEYISTIQNDNNRYQIEIQTLQTQLTNITAVVDFADSTKIAEIADLKQRHQQEMATIQILMEGSLIFRVCQIMCHLLFVSNVKKRYVTVLVMFVINTKAM
jgi:regulator of replication initiation timing